jgi:4-amino-4-deoxy-L-arabinose transferase-like glycosyltransferase
MGSLLLTAMLWTLGIFSLLEPFIVIPLFFGLPLALFPWTKKWLTETWEGRVDYTISFTSVHFWLTWLLVSYLALNFLNVVRPFPIGWDDLGSYMNTPRLLSSYGHFISSLARFQWEYLTSLGFTIFGYDSFVGSTFAMQINWAAGVLATLSVYIFARTFFGKNSGLLSAILYTFLPVVGHFSFADMKIDNATFFTSALGIFAVFLAIEESSKQKKYALLCVAGALLSFSFAIKATAILALLLSFTVLTMAWLGVRGGIFASAASLLILAVYGPLSLQSILTLSGFEVTIPTWLLPSLLIGAMAILMIVIARSKQGVLLRQWVQESAILVAGFVLVLAIWGSHNAWLNGQITFSAVLGAPDRLTPEISYRQREEIDPATLASGRTVRSLPPELKLDPVHAACLASARSEELDRYWGFSKNISHFLLLPWRQVMNIDTVGYYVTLFPALFLFPLLLFVPAFWSEERRWLRLLFTGTTLMMIQWLFIGNGVIWYGITMFLGLSIGLEALLKDSPTTESRSAVRIFLVLSVMICLLNRFWQFDIQRNVMEYPLGKTSAEVLQETTIMHYDNIRRTVIERAEQTPETPYSFRIGTFIPYFIPRNRELLPLADNQLIFFNCINQEKDHALTLKRLKALGFNSIIFDTNAATIESDPKGSLHQKVQNFIDFANDPSLALETPIYDPDDGLAFILLP